MQQFLHKSLALLLSASLLCAYATPGYSLETISGEKNVTAADSAATSNQTDGVYQVTATGSLNVTDGASFTKNSSSTDDGAAINNAGMLTVDGASFNNNTVDYEGGAGGALFLKGTNTINAATFDSNSVTGDYGGGALYLSKDSQSLTLTNSSFTNNTASNSTSAEDAAGGAVALLKKANLENVTFTGNKTVSSVNLGNGGGGAMFIGAEGKVEIEDSFFNTNTSATDGGAIATRTEPPASNIDATLDIEETSFTGNIASGKGGAVYNSFYNSTETPGYVNIDVSTFTGNSATTGGAIYNDLNGKIRVEEGTFTNNTAATAGGAIYNNGTLVVAEKTTFSGNKVTTDGYDGGAIYNNGTLTIEKGVSFTGNESDWGGALFLKGNNTITGADFTDNKVEGKDVSGGALYLATAAENLTLKDSSFTGNTATAADTEDAEDAAGGAASLMSLAEVTNTTFTNNQVLGNTNDSRGGGGALFLGAVGKVTLKDSTFTNNYSSSVGGALATRDSKAPADNKDATLDIVNNTFTGNTAEGNGGAFYNDFYNSNTVSGAAYVADSTFTKNTAGQYGGAIYNASALTLAGTNTFTGNTAGGVANDIHNTGTLNIQGKVSFEGGVTGTGTINVAEGTNIELGLATIEADAIAFAKDTTLGVTLTSDEMGGLKANTISVGEAETDQANLVVTLSKDFVTADKVTKQLTNGTAVDNGSFALANVDNALYNVSFDTATNEVTALRKTQEEQNAMVESAGGNTNDVAVINAFTSSADFGSEAANKTADLINQLVQTDVKAAVEATTALAPDAAASQQAVQSSSNQQLFSAITNRMNNMGGASPRSYALNDGYFYADEASYSVWAQGLLNKSHKENTPDSSAFNGRSTGLAAGADTKINDEWSAGLGYAYLHTNVSSFNRHNRILGDNFFLYGQYRPNNFFVQAALNYGDSKYEEDKYVAGNTVDADYHIKTYSANVTTGYEITENITPLFGLRYMNLQQEGYKDSSDQYISANKEDYLTAVLGVELQQESLLDDIKIIPAVNIGLAYDLLSSNASGHVTLPNGSSYDVTGGRLHRLSLEAGVSITAVVSDNVEVFLSYDGSFREDYNSNTGALKLRYLF